VLAATLERPATDYRFRTLSVLPLIVNDRLNWIDPAGYTVAYSDLPPDWSDQLSRYRFELSVDTCTINGEPYLPHRHEQT